MNWKLSVNGASTKPLHTTFVDVSGTDVIAVVGEIAWIVERHTTFGLRVEAEFTRIELPVAVCVGQGIEPQESLEVLVTGMLCGNDSRFRINILSRSRELEERTASVEHASWNSLE